MSDDLFSGIPPERVPAALLDAGLIVAQRRLASALHLVATADNEVNPIGRLSRIKQAIGLVIEAHQWLSVAEQAAKTAAEQAK